MKKLYFMIVLVSLSVFLTGGCPTPTPKVAEEKVAEEKVAEEKVAEEKVVEEIVAEKKAAEVKVAEEKVAEEIVAEKKAAEVRVAEEKVAEKKAAEVKVAEQKAAEELNAEEEQNAAVIALEQKQALEKEKNEIAVEQDADKSVESPKPVTIISAPEEETDIAINEMEMIYFDYDKSAITPAVAKMIQNNFEWILENRDVQVQLEGHCDERGTNEYNLALGERRAKAVFDHLVSLGANPSQFTMVSFGEERPAVSGSNEVAWAKNRRVDFTRL
ncbi:MAG: peptidoglycan-associated lipoprotein Pal [SAR324 cluster bacterium]